jgi:Histidine kinase
VARKAALMEAQIDLLEGKRKSVGRLHEAIERFAEQVAAIDPAAAEEAEVDSESEAELGTAGRGRKAGKHGSKAIDGETASLAQLVLSAQEDLRREIARQMHDGPAQSLTNIVLQAQIVERLIGSQPEAAAGEVHALVEMVQRTLEATKTFIFEVRPMVLDDLGLVATLRRACRERGARSGVKVDFESIGVDRRLPVELESGLFRILDDALAAQIAGKPDRLSLRLDWGEENLATELTAGREPVHVEAPDLPPEDADLPPALAQMVEERRAAHREAIEAARVASLARLPERLWREVSGRARTLGIDAQLLDEGARLRLEVELPESGAALAALD